MTNQTITPQQFQKVWNALKGACKEIEVRGKHGVTVSLNGFHICVFRTVSGDIAVGGNVVTVDNAYLVAFSVAETCYARKVGKVA